MGRLTLSSRELVLEQVLVAVSSMPNKGSGNMGERGWQTGQEVWCDDVTEVVLIRQRDFATGLQGAPVEAYCVLSCGDLRQQSSTA